MRLWAVGCKWWLFVCLFFIVVKFQQLYFNILHSQYFSNHFLFAVSHRFCAGIGRRKTKPKREREKERKKERERERERETERERQKRFRFSHKSYQKINQWKSNQKMNGTENEFNQSTGCVQSEGAFHRQDNGNIAWRGEGNHNQRKRKHYQ